MNREAWLTALVALLRAHFEASGVALPMTIHVSVGWPSKSARKATGQCFTPEQSKDGSPQIFISPVIAESLDVAETLVHELLHASGEFGHGPEYKRLMRKIGLEGKPKATTAGEELRTLLRSTLKTLPPYPHPVLTLDVAPMKKQTTRMIRLEVDHPEPTAEDTAARCTYSVRTTKKHLAAGLPLCPHGKPLEPLEAVGDATDEG